MLLPSRLFLSLFTLVALLVPSFPPVQPAAANSPPAQSPAPARFATASEPPPALANTFRQTLGLDRVSSIAILPDGSGALIGMQGGSAATLDLGRGIAGRRLQDVFPDAMLVAITPDGAYAATASGRNWSVGGEVGLRLWRLADGALVRSFEGHEDVVTAIALAPDATWLASAATDGTLRRWDLASGAEIQRLRLPSVSSFSSVAVAPDGQTIAAGSYGQVHLWNVSDGTLLRSINAHTSMVRTIAFSPDGAALLSGGDDAAVKLWNSADGTELRSFSGNSFAVQALAFSPDGARIAGGTSDYQVRIWDSASGVLLHTLSNHTNRVNAVAFTPDGARLLSGGDDWSVRVWNVASGALLDTIAPHRESLVAAALSPDGSRALTASLDTVQLWDASSGAQLVTLSGHSQYVTVAAFTSDGNRVLTGSADDSVRLWDAASGALLRTFNGHTGDIRDLAVSADGARLISGSTDRTVRIWDIFTGAEMRSIAHSAVVDAVAFAPDGQSLVSSAGMNGDYRIFRWALDGNPLPGAFAGHTQTISGLAISPDGASLASASSDGTVRLWSLADARLLRVMAPSAAPSGPKPIAFLRNGAEIAVGTATQGVEFWSVAEGRFLRRLQHPTYSLKAFALAAAAPIALGIDNQRSARIWDLGAAVTPTVRLGGHTSQINALSYTADGGRLLTGGADRAVRLWDDATGRLLQTFQGHSGNIRSVALTPDGATALSGGDDFRVFAWDAATGAIRYQLRLDAQVYAVAVAPDGQSFAVANNRSVELRSIADGSPLRILNGHTGLITSLMFAPDGTRLLSTAFDQSVRVWNVADGSSVQVITTTSSLSRAAFAPDGNRILTVEGSVGARIWSVIDGTLLHTFTTSAIVNDAAFTLDGQELLIGEQDGSFILHRIADSTQRFSVETQYPIRRLFPHPGAARAALLSESDSAVFRSLTDGALLGALQGHADVVQDVALAPDGAQALSGASDGTLRLWDAASGAELRVLNHGTRVDSVDYATDGRTLLSAGNGNLKLWNAADGALQRTIATGNSSIGAARFAPDGSRVAAALFGTRIGEVRLYDSASGQPIGLLATEMRTFAIAFSPDGTRIVAGGERGIGIGPLQLWDATGEVLLQSFSGHTQSLTSVAFSPDGRQVLSGGNDYTVRLWDAAGGRLIRLFTADATVHDVGFSPDGRLIAAATSGGVYLWDAVTGALVYAASDPGFYGVGALDFDSNGMLLTGGNESAAQLWRLDMSRFSQRNAIELELDQPLAGSVAAGQWRDYVTRVAPGSSLQVDVVPASGSGPLWLFARVGGLPSLAQYLLRLDTPGADGSYRLALNLPAGDVYLGLLAPETDAGFTITARAVGRALTAITPTTGGNAGPLTLTVRGLGFVEGMALALQRSGQPDRTAEAMSVVAPDELWARVDLSGAAIGMYDLQLIWPDGGRETLVAALTITGGSGARLEARLITPPAVRLQRNSTALVEYANVGDADLRAPLLQVSAVNGRLRLAPGDPLATSVQLLGVSANQPANVLRPGERRRIPLLFVPTDLDLKLDLERLNSAAPVDWDEVAAAVRPADLPAAAWEVIWANFRAAVGATWADYEWALGAQAAYLARYGRPVNSGRELFSALLSNASNLGPGQPLAEAVDAMAPTRGLPLRFARFAPNSLDGRFRLGPLGRGWAHSYEYQLSRPDSAMVIIRSPDGSARQFIRSGGGWEALFGDQGALSELSGGFELREPGGLTWRYSSTGALLAISDPNANQISLEYAGGLLTTITHSDGRRFALAYTPQERISTLTDHAGRVTSYSYDAAGAQLLAVTDPGGGTTSYAYAGADGAAAYALERITGPDGLARSYSYDARGRLARSAWGADVAALAYTYDSLGSTTIADALGASITTRQGARGELLQAENSAGQIWRYGYDAGYRLTTASDPLGHTSTISYDPRSNPLHLRDPLGGTVQARYTGDFNRLDDLRDARYNLTDFSYDARGNLAAITPPVGPGVSATYDAQGNLVGSANQRGQTISYAYNALGQLISKTAPEGVVNYSYDAVGRLIALSDASGNIQLSYDQHDRLTSIAYPDGRSLSFSYDAAGRRTSRIADDGAALHYSYDAVGRLHTIRDEHNRQLVAYSYNAAGRLSGELRGNGTQVAYSYDAAGRLARISHRAANGSEQAYFAYSYDAADRVVAVASQEGATSYSYDAADQLTSVAYPDGSGESYSYDPAGNRVSATVGGTTAGYATNSLNQYTQVGATSYSYDADGNLIAAITAAGATSYNYDSEGRLTQVTAPDGEVTTYSYNALGQRVRAVRAGVETRYLHDPAGYGDVVAEFSAGGALQARYQHGLGLLARRDNSGNDAYYGFDLTGNTRLLTDQGGAVVNRYRYTPFGAATVIVEGVPNPFRFVGQYGVMDEGNGRIFMRARYYDARWGRFISQDPIHFRGGMNLYGYCANAPVTCTDPGGEIYVIAIVVAVSAIFLWTGVLAKVAVNAFEGAWNRDPRAVCLNGRAFSAGSGLVGFAAGTSYKDIIQQGGQTVIQTGAQAAHPAADPIKYVCDYLDPATPPPPIPPTPYDSQSPVIVRAIDPNEKAGPAGVGAQRVVRAEEELVYTIFFENVSTATAPAQEVFVEDQLAALLDWSSLRMIEAAFGATSIAFAGEQLPLQRQAIIADPRPGSAAVWLVDLDARIDAQGLVRWTFRTLDPATGDAPVDATAGFLPPNDSSGRGEGHISFAIRLKPGVALGSVIANQARIIFDTEAPIITNAVTNTVGLVAALALSQEAPVRHGDGSYRYTLRIRNSGPDPAQALQLSASLPEGLRVIAIRPDQGSCSAALACALGTLPPGATLTVDVTLSAAAPGSYSVPIQAVSSAAEIDLSDNQVTLIFDHGMPGADHYIWVPLLKR